MQPHQQHQTSTTTGSTTTTVGGLTVGGLLCYQYAPRVISVLSFLSLLYTYPCLYFSLAFFICLVYPPSLFQVSLSLSSSPSRHLDSIGCRINPTYTLLILLLYTYCVKPPTADLLLCCDKPTADPLLHCGKRSAANLLKSTATRLHNSILRQTY